MSNFHIFYYQLSKIGMEVNLPEIFPCLQKEISLEKLEIELQDLENNQYFHDLVENIIEDYEPNNQKQMNKKNHNLFQMKNIKEIEDIKSTVGKIYKKISAIKIPKGTVIYTIGMAPDYGYFIIHGCVELLRKKNNWEKLQQFQGHTLYRPQQRMQYLQANYRIESKNFQHLESVFFQENVLFNSISFRKIYSRGYFGFRQIMGGSLRTKTAIALQQCILVRLKKQDFDKYLKQFQQKRQLYIMSNMMVNTRYEIVQQILPKLHNIFNSAEIITFDKGQTIIKEEEYTNALYFLVSGEINVSKDVNIEVPKKYMSNQNKGNFVKEIKVNLHKIVKNSFVGQIQPLLSKKERQFTYQSNLNNTILIKFDAHSFIKVISQSSSLEREMMIGAKYKYSTTMETYISQKSTLIKSYFKQFQQLDHKKKEKNVANLLKNENNFKQNQLYELFKRQGSFFRDSFQRLQGFNDFQSKYNPSKSSINRHKIKSSLEFNPTESKILKKEVNNYASTSPVDQDISFEATKRVLMSPTKTSNPFQLINNQFKSKLQPVSQHSELNSTKSSGHLRKKKRLFSKFQQLKKDETIFKRVMIKNGQVEAKKETDKSNRIEAIVNHKFDEVVKQCLTRKNVGLRKALLEKRQDIIRDQFTRTVATLPSRSMSSSHFQQIGSKTLTFKGAEQFRKKIDGFKNLRGSAFNSSQKPRDAPKLQQCIGFNKKPLSSEIKQRRMFMSPSKNGPRSPQRIVLLNHMMKPIIYSSSQF